MTKILHVQSSPKGEKSRSLELAKELLARLNGEVVTHEIHTGVPLMQSEQIDYMYGAISYESASDSTKKAIDYQDAAVKDILSADTIVLSTPLWNLGMPGSVKAWFDQVIKIGHTWKIESGKYVGLATNIKKVYIVGTSSGIPVNKGNPSDFLTGYITALFKYIGANDIQFIWATGSGEILSESMNLARQEIAQLAV